ncbi:IS630 family transposase [Arthrospira platensis BEA 1257B]
MGDNSQKKLTDMKKGDEEKRRKFEEKLSKTDKKRLIYVDESGFDNRDDYPLGYSPKGERCHALKSGKRTERVSWIGDLGWPKLFTPLTFEGSCNRNLFEAWFDRCLLPQLEEGDIIILDNGSFHHGESIKEMVEEVGCEIWYLPAYSPDLNKIENWWSPLKTWMRPKLKDFEAVRECVDAAFKSCTNVFAYCYI